MASRALTAPCLLVLAAALIACGSEREERLAKLEPMVAQDEADPAEAGPVEVPRISEVRLRPERPRAGRSVTAQVETAQGPRPQLKYEWRLNGRPLDGAAAVDLPGSRPGDQLELVVTPMLDGRAGSPVTHRVRLAGLAPRIAGIRLNPPRGASAGSQITATPMLDDVDPDQVSLSYVWSVNGRRTFERDATLSTEGLKRGDRVSVEIVARQGSDTSAPFRSEELELVNGPPTVKADPLSVGADGIVRTRLRASDPDGDQPIRFELKQGPDGLELDRLSGEISWNPQNAAAGRHLVEVEASDGRGGLTRSKFDLNLSEESLPAAPAHR